MSDWVKISGMGSVGMEPDRIPTDRPLESLDIAVNMRSIGPDLGNAGGYEAVQFGDIPDEITPSNCSPCPNIYLGDSFQDGIIDVDRSWQWDWNDPYHFLMALEINAGQQEYDQVLKVQAGECNAKLLERIEIEILNTATLRRIRVRSYNDQGTLLATHFDVDPTIWFENGQHQWVIIEQFDAGNSQVGYNIWIGSLLITTSAVEIPQQNLTRFLTVRRQDSPFGLAVPIALYRYSQTLRDCLTSGNFNGFGRCLPVEQSDAFQWDRSSTDVDIDLYRGNRVATPKAGTPTQRTAYLDNGRPTGKVYFEWLRDIGSCKSDGYYVGGATRGTQLGTNAPGTIDGSWGYVGPAGRLQVDGQPDTVIGYFNLVMDRVLIAIDFDTGELWIGGGEDPTPQWIGGGTPGAGATAFQVGNSASDMVVLAGFSAQNQGALVLSSVESCRHAPPSGFGYLPQPST